MSFLFELIATDDTLEGTIVLPSNLSGDTTIEIENVGGRGIDGALYPAYAPTYPAGGGGESTKARYTIAPGTSLNYHLPAPGRSADAAFVQDESTSLVNIFAANGQDALDGGFGGDTGGSAAQGSLLVPASEVRHPGGSSVSNGVVPSGGASSGCPTSNGNSNSAATGGLSAGIDSGKGGDGSAIDDGGDGQTPGGGSGSSLAGTAGKPGYGRIRISAATSNVKPTFLVDPTIAGVANHVGELGWRLTCNDGVTDTGDKSRQWFSSTDGIGTGSAALSGETRTTILLHERHVGLYISCKVTADNGAYGSTIAQSNYIHCILPTYFPERVALTGFDNPSPYDGKFIISDHTVSDGAEQAMPSPVAWDIGSPQAGIDWSWHATAVTTGGQARSNESGLTLVAPSFGIAAAHATGNGTKFEFTRPNGALETRTSSLVANTTMWDLGGDLRLVKLNAPITTITPIPIVDDCSTLAGRTALAIELNRHLSLHPLDAGTENANLRVLYGNTNSDIIEGGDSGHALVVLVGGRAVLVGAFYSAISVYSPSHFIKEMQAIIQAAGENLTIAKLPQPRPHYRPESRPATAPTCAGVGCALTI